MILPVLCNRKENDGEKWKLQSWGHKRSKSVLIPGSKTKSAVTCYRTENNRKSTDSFVEKKTKQNKQTNGLILFGKKVRLVDGFL